MASSTARLSAVLTLDDRASPGLVKSSRNAERLRGSLLSAGQGLATFASSMSSLLVTTGALESKTGQYATAVFAVSGAFLSLIPALVQINSLLRTQAVIQAFLTTLRNPFVGIGLVAGAGAVAVGAGLLINRAVSNSTDERNRLRNPQPVVVNNDLRGATIRGEDDLNQLSYRLGRDIPALR